jgi:hypothetical protein
MQDRYLHKQEGREYHIPQTYPNWKKVRAGSKVVLLGKNKGKRNLVRGYGTIKSVEEYSSTYNEKPCKITRISFDEKNYKKLNVEMSNDVWNDIKRLPGYNAQLAIRVINKEIFDRIAREGARASSREIHHNKQPHTLHAPQLGIDYDTAADYQSINQEETEILKVRKDWTSRDPNQSEQISRIESIISNLNSNPDKARERLLYWRNELKRNPKFTEAVLQAYRRRCAICGIQLEIVQAAHIVAVKDGGTDDITNGIALCPNHHVAFDNDLIVINTQYQVLLNHNKIKELEEFKSDTHYFIILE